MARKSVVYATKDKIEKLNPKNVKLIDKYFSFKNMNLSDSSKRSYQSDFNQWLVYIMENYKNEHILDIIEDTDEMVDLIEDFVAFCTSVLGNNERRIQRRMSSISSFFLFLLCPFSSSIFFCSCLINLKRWCISIWSISCGLNPLCCIKNW